MERTKTRLATVLLGSCGAAALLVGPAAAAPSPSPHDEKLATAVRQWFTGGGHTRITVLQTDFESIAKAAGGNDVSGVKTGCTTLAADVDKAQHYVPLPDGEAHQHWAAALDMYAKGAADCVNGVAGLDAGLMNRANDEIRQGGGELAKATARVEDILR